MNGVYATPFRPALGEFPTGGFEVKELRASLFAPGIRLLERLLPVPALLAVLFPVAWIRALSHRLIKGDKMSASASRWLSDKPRPAHSLDRLPVYLNRTFEFLPDRLSLPKWQNRCRILGFEHLRSALTGKNGVILAFAHFGAYPLLRSWLRAAGIPVSMLVGGNASGRSPLMRRKDRWAIFPEIPPAFYQNELADAINHLKSGRPLAIAIDAPTGRQMNVGIRDGGKFVMATGAIRLARRHAVPLIACSIYPEAPWRFVVDISPPVAPEIWTRGDESVGADLLEKLLPTIQRHPDQCEAALISRFQPETRSAVPDSVT